MPLLLLTRCIVSGETFTQSRSSPVMGIILLSVKCLWNHRLCNSFVFYSGNPQESCILMMLRVQKGHALKYLSSDLGLAAQ
jgi:hypothetical protein